MKLVVIDYGAGNVASVVNALNQVKDQAEVLISNKISDIKSATHLLLPGVSSFGESMSGLGAIEGLLSEIRNQVLKEKKPFLGICAGMQILANFGHEDGEHSGLGFIDGRVEKINTANLKVPHMGWNNIIVKAGGHAVLKGIESGEHFYFANSYHFICQNENNVLAHAEYGQKISAIVAKENIVGAQFHPEKSGEAGLKLLKNFLNWRP